MSKAWRVITDAFVQSILIQTAQKPKYMQHTGKTPKFFQATVGGVSKRGKIGEVALQVRAPKLGKQDCWILSVPINRVEKLQNTPEDVTGPDGKC